MGVRVIVCGGRDFNDKELCFEKLDDALKGLEDVVIVSGHANGADKFGEEYARENNLPCSVFKADWKRYGRGAGPVRNREMLEYAVRDNALIIAFWDGKSKGTANMIAQAENSGAKVIVNRY